MKTFKSFVSEKTKSHTDLPLLQTSFGTHSKSNKTKKKVVEESAKDLSKADHKDQTENHSLREEDKIHEENEIPEHKSVFKYTEGSKAINKTLHNIHTGGKEIVDRQNIRELDGVLDKHKIKHDTHVFTGMRRDPRTFWEGKDRSKPITTHHPAYISTSTNFKEAHLFAEPDSNDNHSEDHHKPLNHDAPKLDKDSIIEHVMKLHLPAGTRAGSIRDQSDHPHENEVLVHRGHDIEIHPRPTIHPDGTHVWHARVVGHNPIKI